MTSGQIAETICESLRQEILKGELAPGARLGVRHIATRFGTSDLPARQALWMLEREGFVSNVPYAGMSVRAYSAQEIQDNYQIRGFLESMAMRLSPTPVPAAQRTKIAALLAELKDVVAAGDSDRYGELNQEFHLQLIVTCPNETLKELIRSLWNGQRMYRSLFHFDARNAKKSLAEHRAIAVAYLRGDTERAANLLIEHRHRVAESVVDAITSPDESAQAST